MAITFQVRIGIPGSFTIEVDAAPLLVPQNPTNLFPPFKRPVTVDPASYMSTAWMQGWSTPMTQRLIALGGNTNFQLIGFECPSVDTTDMAWGGTGTIDATSDPAVVNVTPFGTSNFGRSFAVGDYIIWDDATLANGRYQYEIDRIVSLSPFTLQRRSKAGSAGSAFFGTPMAAHTGNFYQMLDKTFFDRWDGTHQVFKFLWDNMIVSAVSLSTVGLNPPSLVNLIPIPPTAAALGLAT